MLANRYTLYILFIGLLLFSRSHAQQGRFGNEWINYEQTYFKIPVWEKGVYRIPYDQLRQAGFPVEKNPVSYQLFKQGTEQAITVSGQEDGKFDSNDYVEFYGVPNDGSRDASLYRDPKLQTNPKVSLFSDTTYYYLTYRLDSQPGKRMETVAAQAPGTLQAEPFHWQDELLLFKAGYPVGPTYPIGVRYLSGMTISSYEVGKGYTDARINNGQSKSYTFSLTNPYTAGDKPKLELSIYGGTPDPHKLEIRGGTSSTQNRLLGTIDFKNYDLQLFKADLDWSDLSAQSHVLTVASTKGSFDNEYNYVVYTQLSYPQALTLQGVNTGKTFRLRANTTGTSFVQLGSASATDQIYDITQPDQIRRITGTLTNGVLSAVISQTSSGRSLWVNRQLKNVATIKPTGFRKIDPAKSNYLIVTNKRLQKPAGGYADIVKEYATYRASAAGGKHDTLVVDIDFLADQFNYGERSGVAVRHFADYMIQHGKPEHLFLIGKALAPQFYRFIPDFYQNNLVPAGGWPGSDWVTVEGLTGEKDIPGVPVGRLSVTKPEEVLAYLNKVKEYERQEPALWRKSFLHLSGGKTTGELNLFRNYVENYKTIAEKNNLGGKVSITSKKTDDPVEFINISSSVNQGLGFITFFGHAAAQISDIDVGYVTNESLGYRNKGKYPIMIINGCDAGNIFDNNLAAIPLSSDWVNTADRGAILALATSFSGFPTYLNGYSTTLYEQMFKNELGLGKSFGSSLLTTIRSYLKAYPGEMALGHSQQFVLQGDPAIVPFPYTKPDYAVTNSGLFLKGFDGKEVVASADSFRVGMVVSNLGRNLVKPFTISLKRTLSNGREIDLGSRRYAPVAYQDTLYFTVSNAANSGGNNRFDVTIDAANQIDELNKQNNKAFISLALPGSLARPVLPHDFAIVGTQENGAPTARLMAEYTPTNASVTAGNILFELDTSAAFTSTFKKTTTLPSSNAEGWKVALLASDSTVYYWRVRDADQAVSGTNQWSTYSFTYIKGVEDGWAQSQSNQFENVLTDQVLLRNGRWDFSGSATSGVLTSSLIGPTTRWGAIRQQVTKNAQQKSSLDVYGVDARGNETLLITNLTSTLIDISKIDARQYPNLRLREKISGPTAPQLKRWLVSYQGVPEGALYVQGRTSYLSTLPLTLEEGASFTQALNFNVLSTATFTDSLLVTETLTNAAASVTTTKQYRVAAAKSIPLSLTYRNLQAGENRLSISVNPQVLPEVSYTNNTVTFALNVQADRTAPTLEVTFDGRTIREGDYVSANPVIVVRVKDSNKYAIKKDTVGIDLYWQKPEGALQRLSYKNPAMKWDTLAGNEVRVTYQPKNLAEGTYFFQAQGSDVAGNNAGALPYAIRFQVKAETGLQQFLVSPNPLELYTRFHLVLTGDSLPDAMTVEIMSMQGQLLRVLSNESQPLRVGTNEYFWNGTDHQGNRLPPGTYIYRLKLSQNGQTYPIIDPAFKATGRVVIVR
ncbi:hypothetical protein BWI93_12495 [Siphonobacter sp. BAB-5385]|uniref:putative type IX secretion system sortase PorU2 n=1 Tax=Siphonobacter sp. BAB-5385 TaxID=1864822 RepID=UPI000B9ECB71|nr:C25 family cysteine peptidase [Siphonobacter sp. BAB-5385]OZI07781.1 hypothetical protein BWI93_12495 [Siphonobacter sp. BAB-5385]